MTTEISKKAHHQALQEFSVLSERSGSGQILTTTDFQQPLDVQADGDEIGRAIFALTTEQQAQLYLPYLKRLQEYWQRIIGPQQPWQEFLEEEEKHQTHSQWIQNSETGALRLSLNPQAYHQVLTSRAFPLISTAESQHIASAKVFCFGLSTGLAPLVGWTQIGGMHVHGSDFDEISLSNLIRIPGATDEDVGTPKTTHAGRILTGINPHIDLVLHDYSFSDQQLKKALTEYDIVLETADGTIKSILRQTQKELLQQGKLVAPIIMGTNAGWQPVIALETAADPPFLKQLTPPEMYALSHPKENPRVYIQALLKAVGEENVPTRQIINVLLGGIDPRMAYLAQHGPNSMGAAFGVVRTMVNTVNRYPQSNQEYVIPVDHLSGLKTTGDDGLLQELQELYPQVFSPFNDLNQAARVLAKKFLNLDIHH